MITLFELNRYRMGRIGIIETFTSFRLFGGFISMSYSTVKPKHKEPGFEPYSYNYKFPKNGGYVFEPKFGILHK